MDIIKKYFPKLSIKQSQQIEQLYELYQYWNQQINIISRKDIIHLYERHILHSLSVCKITNFYHHDKVLDVGTGGGLPGIPLAIMFPETHFLLIDSVGKKIKVVQDIIAKLNLYNVEAQHLNAKLVKGKYTYIVSRAVCELKELYTITKKNTISGTTKIITFKGGNIDSEIKSFVNQCDVIHLSSFFEEPFFETKKIVILHVK